MDNDLKRKYDNERKDFVDRKTGFVERMFDKLFFAVKENILATILVIMIFYNGLITWKWINSVDDRVSDNLQYSERIIEEVRRRIRPEIDREVNRKTKKIENKVDDANNTIEDIKNEVTKTIRESLK